MNGTWTYPTICPTCGGYKTDGAARCMNCINGVPVNEYRCESCGRDGVGDNDRCPKCQKRFCPQCLNPINCRGKVNV